MERRHFMKGFVATGALLPVSGLTAFIPARKEKKPDPAPQHLFFKSEADEFAFLNALGKAHFKFADVGELLAIRSLIDDTLVDKGFTFF